MTDISFIRNFQRLAKDVCDINPEIRLNAERTLTEAKQGNPNELRDVCVAVIGDGESNQVVIVVAATMIIESLLSEWNKLAQDSKKTSSGFLSSAMNTFLERLVYQCNEFYQMLEKGQNRANFSDLGTQKVIHLISTILHKGFISAPNHFHSIFTKLLTSVTLHEPHTPQQPFNMSQVSPSVATSSNTLQSRHKFLAIDILSGVASEFSMPSLAKNDVTWKEHREARINFENNVFRCLVRAVLCHLTDMLINFESLQLGNSDVCGELKVILRVLDIFVEWEFSHPSSPAFAPSEPNFAPTVQWYEIIFGDGGTPQSTNNTSSQQSNPSRNVFDLFFDLYKLLRTSSLENSSFSAFKVDVRSIIKRLCRFRSQKMAKHLGNKEKVTSDVYTPLCVALCDIIKGNISVSKSYGGMSICLEENSEFCGCLANIASNPDCDQTTLLRSCTAGDIGVVEVLAEFASLIFQDSNVDTEDASTVIDSIISTFVSWIPAATSISSTWMTTTQPLIQSLIIKGLKLLFSREPLNDSPTMIHSEAEELTIVATDPWVHRDVLCHESMRLWSRLCRSNLDYSFQCIGDRWQGVMQSVNSVRLLPPNAGRQAVYGELDRLLLFIGHFIVEQPFNTQSVGFSSRSKIPNEFLKKEGVETVIRSILQSLCQFLLEEISSAADTTATTAIESCLFVLANFINSYLCDGPMSYCFCAPETISGLLDMICAVLEQVLTRLPSSHTTIHCALFCLQMCADPFLEASRFIWAVQPFCLLQESFMQLAGISGAHKTPLRLLRHRDIKALATSFSISTVLPKLPQERHSEYQSLLDTFNNRRVTLLAALNPFKQDLIKIVKMCNSANGDLNKETVETMCRHLNIFVGIAKGFNNGFVTAVSTGDNRKPYIQLTVSAVLEWEIEVLQIVAILVTYFSQNGGVVEKVSSFYTHTIRTGVMSQQSQNIFDLADKLKYFCNITTSFGLSWEVETAQGRSDDCDLSKTLRTLLKGLQHVMNASTDSSLQREIAISLASIQTAVNNFSLQFVPKLSCAYLQALQLLAESNAELIFAEFSLDSISVLCKLVTHSLLVGSPKCKLLAFEAFYSLTFYLIDKTNRRDKKTSTGAFGDETSKSGVFTREVAAMLTQLFSNALSAKLNPTVMELYSDMSCLGLSLFAVHRDETLDTFIRKLSELNFNWTTDKSGKPENAMQKFESLRLHFALRANEDEKLASSSSCLQHIRSIQFQREFRSIYNILIFETI